MPEQGCMASRESAPNTCGAVRCYAENLGRNAEIVARRKAGAWPNEIAREMGLSRNAVIGVLNRNRLCDANLDESQAPRSRKLTIEQARWVRATCVPLDRERGVSALARAMGVNSGTISRIVAGTLYRAASA